MIQNQGEFVMCCNTDKWKNDKWEFYEDKRSEWRWRRKAPNGQIVGAACEGYKNKKDCKSNAERHGWQKS